MTEFSTNNDINNKSHLSQPLQNSPRHFHHQTHNTNTNTPLYQNSPQQHFLNINKHLSSHNILKQQQQQTHQTHTHNNKNNQQTLPLNSSANIFNNTSANANAVTTTATTSVSSSSPTSAIHSPLHYRKPLNSPNNSPFSYAAYYGGGNINDQKSTAAAATTATTAAQQQQLLLQQHLRSSNKLPHLTQTQYQQHLNDLLLQQQHLQQQQQQLLTAKDSDDELSEESLKQNVAIVLNNLDRYNNALRSIILNEEVSNNSSSSVFFDDSLLDISNCNNNFLLNSNNTAAMATAVTPESDYNSNATTPGSRSNAMLPPSLLHDSNLLQQQQQQHVVGFSTTTAAAIAAANGGGGLVVGSGVGLNNVNSIGNGGLCSNNLNCSLASSHDFTHDNSDYQWFLDYGYRDGCGGLQRSVLSSLSASYNALGDLIYYEDLAKNLDANLAEVDMESFRAEDIHSLLSQLPSYCKSLGGSSRLQHSLMLQQQHMLPLSTQNMTSQTSINSGNELIDNSICKSELLFSPVKESHISVDSLDMDAYPDDGDIILTCKANKDNYTIAFEGSVLYSDESFYEPIEIAMKNKQNCINLHSNLEDIVKRKSLEVSMSRSEQAFTTRSKLQKSNTTQLQSLYMLVPSPTHRYPSGNNNTSDAFVPIRHAPFCTVRKSGSLPNLRESHHELLACNGQQPQHQQQEQQLNVSQAVSTSTMDSCKSRNLLPMCQMPISCNSTSASISERLTSQCQQHQQLQQQQQQQRHKHRCCCSSNSSSAAVAANSHNSSASVTQQKHAHISGSTSSGNSNPPAFNLVKLFIKQKSSNCSLENQASSHTCMDVSSGCWPSSDAAGSSSSSSLEQRLRKKSMNDSGKGSALSRHDEEELLRDLQNDLVDVEQLTSKKHLRTRDAVFDDDYPSSSSTGSLTATNSPAHRRRSMPLRNPQVCHLATQHNSGTSAAGSFQSSDGSRSTSEQLTQVYLSAGTNASGTTILERKKLQRTDSSRPVSTASSSEMITRSMQTSCGGSLSTRSSMSERFRCVPPSFLAKLNNLGEERQAPIYVIYPNYALPDLGFVKTAASADVIFSPFNYKMTMAGATSGSTSSLKKRFSLSANDDEILKNMDYKHVMDWQSLATLLPVEYRRRLKHIPEVNTVLHDMEGELSQRPLFCMTPPIRRNRPHICDCAQYFQQQQQTQLPNGEEGSSSSGSSQQPSSGYRGSSTLLTDSELDNASDPLKQMYVYQYEQQRMDSGVDMSPAAGRTPPQPMPRGILRKSSSAQSTAARSKRNSMIEEQQSKVSKLEKRRSLQEPPYPHAVGSSDELYEVYEEDVEIYAVPEPRKERLSRKDLTARARAENFLSSLPRSELKYYAEIAAILESSEQQVEYDAAALKKEVSRALSQQKKVSFNDIEEEEKQLAEQQQQFLNADIRQQRFSTPPNSPNISMAAASLRMRGAQTTARRCSQAEQHASERRKASTLDEKEQRKIESNRFKRLQIQWELMSKDSSMLKELANEQQTKSGGSTPTSATAHKSRIPRPVSYPAGKSTEKLNIDLTSIVTPTQPKTKLKPKTVTVSPQIARITTQDANGKTSTRSPSRIVPPKRYSMISTAGSAAATTVAPAVTSPSTPITTGIGATRARTPTSRAAVTAPNTPKRRVQSPRTIPRVR